MVQWRSLSAVAWREAVQQSSATEGVKAALALIEELNPTMNAFTVVLAEQALKQARVLDALPVSERGPLHGVPVAIKDENDVAGTPTTWGTSCNSSLKISDSLVVERLKAAGAIIIGKTTMPAFGAFPVTESEAFGVTRHPLDEGKSPGGSSGGSAVAVASGMVPLALGGDGGGSVRIPAARCGLVGFKPARGEVPTAPYEHLWHDLGTAGPLARTAEDARLMYRVITAQNSGEFALPQATRLRIAVNLKPASPLARLHPDHRRAIWQVAQELRALGHTIEWVTDTPPDPTLPFIVQFFAGINDEIAALENPERLEHLHRHTRLMGAWAKGSTLERAKKKGEKLSEILEMRYFEAGYDLLLTPTVADRARPAGLLQQRGFVRAMLDSIPAVAYTLLWNVSGHPALALPVGTGTDGLPVSVQLVASRKHPATEDLLFSLAQHLGR